MGFVRKLSEKGGFIGNALGGDPTGIAQELGLPGTLGSLTGSDAADAAEEAAELLAAGGDEQIAFQREALEIIRGDLQPFREVAGPEQLAQLSQAPLGDISNQIQRSTQGLTREARAREAFQSQGNLNPNIDPTQIRNPEEAINSPFFTALADDAQRRVFSNRAARGKLGSGGTAEALQESLVRIGSGLATDQLNRDVVQRGQFVGEQQQQFGQQLAGRQQGAGEQAQQFAQEGDELSLINLLQQQGLQNTLGSQQQGFNQLFDITRLGQSSAAQQATQQGASANNISNIIGDIANARAGGIVGAAGAKNQAQQGLLQTIGTVGGALFASDIRVKENIEYLGSVGDIPWFKFDYIDGDKDQFGTMAQLVIDDYPDSVHDIDGILHVDYGTLLWQ